MSKELMKTGDRSNPKGSFLAAGTLVKMKKGGRDRRTIRKKRLVTLSNRKRSRARVS